MSEVITPAAVEAYLQQLYDDGDPVRQQMEALAQERGFPIVGPVCGRFLYQATRMINAKRVFELGSGYGYSALFFSRAVGVDGEVHCTELSAENIRLAERFLTLEGTWSRVTYHQEEATTALRRVGGLWDIIYNDIDKEGYSATIDLTYDRLRPGGLFITDNVLWYGRVFEGQSDGSTSTQAIQDFTRRLFAHPGFMTTIYPVRDGMAVALKL